MACRHIHHMIHYMWTQYIIHYAYIISYGCLADKHIIHDIF